MSNPSLILSREEYPELYAAIAKAYGPLPMTNRLKNITEDEAIDYLNICKTAYVKAVNEADSPSLASQYRNEMRYWEDFIAANWPSERVKREPFGGKTEPMTKEQMIGAMDYLYDRLKKVRVDVDTKEVREVVGELYGSLKTLAGVVDELIRAMP